MARLLALTGATGFIGKHIKTELAGRGWRIRALTRKPAESHGGAQNVEWVPGDLDNADALERLVRGADAVVHCAGLIKARRARDFEAVNADGTRRLAQIAGGQPKPPRFVLVSSLAAREPHLSPYAHSKMLAEDIVRGLDQTPAATILRPPAVYGPGDAETLTIYRAVKRGLAPLPGGGGRVSWIHVSDLASAVAAILETPSTAGQTFEIDDGHEQGYSLRETLGLVAGHLGVKPFFIPIPRALLELAGALNLAAAAVAGYRPMLTPGKAREICHPDWLSRGNRLSELTSWRPRLQMDQGLAETLSWYRREKLL